MRANQNSLPPPNRLPKDVHKMLDILEKELTIFGGRSKIIALATRIGIMTLMQMKRDIVMDLMKGKNGKTKRI